MYSNGLRTPSAWYRVAVQRWNNPGADMSSTTVYNEIKGYLQSVFNGVYPIIDFDEIEPNLGQGEAPFIALEEVTSDEQQIGIGDLTAVCLRESGAIIVHCFTPSPQSSASARSIAETIQQSLRFRTINQVRMYEVTPPDLEMMNNGLWTAGAVAASYEYDTHVPHPNGA